jgi:hypothetical protein
MIAPLTTRHRLGEPLPLKNHAGAGAVATRGCIGGNRHNTKPGPAGSWPHASKMDRRADYEDGRRTLARISHHVASSQLRRRRSAHRRATSKTVAFDQLSLTMSRMVRVETFPASPSSTRLRNSVQLPPRLIALCIVREQPLERVLFDRFCPARQPTLSGSATGRPGHRRSTLILLQSWSLFGGTRAAARTNPFRGTT